MPVTAAVHRFINYVKQYEKCDPAAGEIPLSVPLLAGNCEPDNLSYEVFQIVNSQSKIVNHWTAPRHLTIWFKEALSDLGWLMEASGSL